MPPAFWRDGVQCLTGPLTFLAICHAAYALPSPTRRATDDLVCGAATGWYIVEFFALNYVAHAFTIKSVPGTTARKTFQLAVLALLLPYSGVIRARDAISCANFGDNELRHAQRVGALCMVKRLSQAANGASMFDSRDKNCTIQGEITGDLGKHGFGLMLVPRDLPLAPLGGGDIELGQQEPADADNPSNCSKYQLLPKPKPTVTDNIRIANSNTALKSLVAIVQLIYATYTLYKTAGRQIDRWGYASFGLTVIPYAIMSFLNLLAAVLSPDFPSLSLIRNDDMEAAEKEGIRFAGVVAMVARGDELVDSKSRQHSPPSSLGFWRELPTLILGWLALAAPYAVIGVLTHFRPQGSQWSERLPIMIWLVGGQVFGWWYSYFFRPQTYLKRANVKLPLDQSYWGAWIILSIISGVAVGGMIIVGRQITEFGRCVEVPAHVVDDS